MSGPRRLIPQCNTGTALGRSRINRKTADRLKRTGSDSGRT